MDIDSHGSHDDGHSCMNLSHVKQLRTPVTGRNERPFRLDLVPRSDRSTIC